MGCDRKTTSKFIRSYAPCPKVLGTAKKSCYVHEIHFVRVFFFFFFFWEFQFFYTIFFGKFPLILAQQVEFTLEKTRFNFRKFLFLQKIFTSTHSWASCWMKFINLLKYVFIHYNTNSVFFFFFFFAKKLKKNKLEIV